MDSQPGALGQILINLVNNAYLHAFEGAQPGRARLSARRPRATRWITVADNNVGVPRNAWTRCSSPLLQHQGQGAGLGMAIVQNLVTKSLGGRITVQSTGGRGTQFHIVLPRQAPEPTSVAIK